MDLVHSPAKVTRIALTQAGFPTEASDTNHDDIIQMIQQLIKEKGSHDLLADLANLASRA